MITQDNSRNPGTKFNLVSLAAFLKGLNCDEMQLELLTFWGLHPRARLSLYAVKGALDLPQMHLRTAIGRLTQKGILKAQGNGNGLTTYTLANPQIHDMVCELAQLDWSEKMFLLKQYRLMGN